MELVKSQPYEFAVRCLGRAFCTGAFPGTSTGRCLLIPQGLIFRSKCKNSVLRVSSLHICRWSYVVHLLQKLAPYSYVVGFYFRLACSLTLALFSRLTLEKRIQVSVRLRNANTTRKDVLRSQYIMLRGIGNLRERCIPS